MTISAVSRSVRQRRIDRGVNLVGNLLSRDMLPVAGGYVEIKSDRDADARHRPGTSRCTSDVDKPTGEPDDGVAETRNDVAAGESDNRSMAIRVHGSTWELYMRAGAIDFHRAAREMDHQSLRGRRVRFALHEVFGQGMNFGNLRADIPIWAVQARRYRGE